MTSETARDLLAVGHVAAPRHSVAERRRALLEPDLDPLLAKPAEQVSKRRTGVLQVGSRDDADAIHGPPPR